mgnify:FL=1
MKLSEYRVDFSNKKVGDRVWAIKFGDGTIIGIYGSLPALYEGELLVKFDRDISYALPRSFDNQPSKENTIYYRLDGKLDESDISPSLFNSEPEILQTEEKENNQSIEWCINNQVSVKFFHKDGKNKAEVQVNNCIIECDTIIKAVRAFSSMDIIIKKVLSKHRLKPK